MATEECREFEDGMRGDMRREVFMAFALVSDVNETVVDAHLEFVGGGIARTLFGVELFETLQGWIRVSRGSGQGRRRLLFMSCCSSRATEKPGLSRSKWRARMWNRAQRS